MVFSFFFKKKKQFLFKEFIDIHNHLLPGVDDGSKSVKQSIEMLDLYEELGVKKVIATPHIYKDLYPNTKNSIKNSFELLNKTSKKHNVEILGYAAEYLVDEFFLEKVNEKKSLLKCFNDHILIEIPFFSQLKNLNEAIFNLQNQGYLPILAHPERYHAIEKIDLILELKKKGVKMQLNALSLMGYYGPDVKKKASSWLKKGIYNYIGTDAHNKHQLNKLKDLTLDKKEFIAWNKISEKQSEISF
jgi:protein-tyrosine phosphatase